MPAIQPALEGPDRTLLIACGALAREVVELIRANAWRHLTVSCLPAAWHNTPEKIPGAIRERIRAAKPRYDRIFVLYGDCGTGGELDRVLADEGVERIEGPHCYSFFAGNKVFEELAEAEIGTFYLTDYLARHFDRLVIQALGLDRHPELHDLYFSNYTKLIYLAQTEDADLKARAEAAAARLNLAYEYRFTGYGEMADFLEQKVDLPKEPASWLS